MKTNDAIEAIISAARGESPLPSRTEIERLHARLRRIDDSTYARELCRWMDRNPDILDAIPQGPRWIGRD